jgi:hypothetical protein
MATANDATLGRDRSVFAKVTRNEATRFLACLGCGSADGEFTFQTFADSDALKEDATAAKRLARIIHGTLDE